MSSGRPRGTGQLSIALDAEEITEISPITKLSTEAAWNWSQASYLQKKKEMKLKMKNSPQPGSTLSGALRGMLDTPSPVCMYS
jgi:hypothetical protein